MEFADNHLCGKIDDSFSAALVGAAEKEFFMLFEHFPENIIVVCGKISD
jgi:hypothetical protein